MSNDTLDLDALEAAVAGLGGNVFVFFPHSGEIARVDSETRYANVLSITDNYEDEQGDAVAAVLSAAPALLARARRADELEADLERDAGRLSRLMDDMEAAGNRIPTCAHCQGMFTVSDGAMAAHVRQCPSNPMVADLATRDARIAALETVARYREERDTAIRVLVAARRECDAMKPVVDAAEAWVKGDWATARHKREELTRAIDTFRSTSKPQEPTSE
jgi:hypothetical protein